MNLIRIWLAAVSVLLGMGLILSGCGEKIAIPQPEGLFSGSPYRVIDEFTDLSGPLQLTVANNTMLRVL